MARRYPRSPSDKRRLASSSPTTCSVSGSKRNALPRRYEAFARWTSAQEMCPSSMGAFKLLRLSTADTVDEIGEVIAARLAAGAGSLVGADPALIAEAVFVAPGQVSVRSVKDVADRIVAIEQTAADAGFVVRDPVPDLELHHLAMAVGLIEFEGAGERVRRLLVVIEHEVAADRGDAIREPDAEPPPRDVDLVDPLVAEVPVSGVPDPVPVVVKAIAGERLQRRRTGPEVVVDSTGNGFRPAFVQSCRAA